MKKPDLGQLGENMAAKYLLSKSYTILERNWRFGKKEVDIIAQTGKHIVFVEVKARDNAYMGPPWQAVGLAKQKTIIATAHEYIVQHDIDLEPRFDIISIVHNQKYSNLEHLEDAFYPLSR